MLILVTKSKICNFSEGKTTRKTSTGLPLRQTENQLKTTTAEAAREVLSFRPPGAPPADDDPVALLAAQLDGQGQGDLHAGGDAPLWSERVMSQYMQDIEDVLSQGGDEGRNEEGEGSSRQKNPTGFKYYKKCDREGCDYVTIGSDDPLAIQGISFDLKNHIEDRHRP